MKKRAARRGASKRHCIISAILLGCGADDSPPPAPVAQPAPPAPLAQPAPLESFAGLQAPPRVLDDGSPDTCALLGPADPGALLGSALGTAQRIYGLCLVETAPPAQPERSVGLEIRKDPSGVPGNFDAFWEREGGGVGMLGSSREQVKEIENLGDYALWFPIDGGMQLFTYWKNAYILVLTVRGVETERALPWARELAATAVQRGS